MIDLTVCLEEEKIDKPKMRTKINYKITII